MTEEHGRTESVASFRGAGAERLSSNSILTNLAPQYWVSVTVAQELASSGCSGTAPSSPAVSWIEQGLSQVVHVPDRQRCSALGRHAAAG